LDDASRLEQDTLAALITIRGWINTFTPINRVPSDVLSLIPTYLPSQGDRFRASFVCCHWRMTFLGYAALWTRLRLTKGKTYVKTLLDRAKGSPLTIFASRTDPVRAIKLLRPHANQITSLEFANCRRADIRRFSEFFSGSLPSLRTLEINAAQEIGRDPLFNGDGLKEFRLHSKRSPILSYFAFPNLTSFELSVVSAEVFNGSRLLDFLEASPMLQEVYMMVIAPISLEGIPRGMLIFLQDVERFCLVARDGGSSYKLATHISCPSAQYTSFTHTREKEHALDALVEKFPEASWDTIVRQYTTSPIEEVTFETESDSDYFIACSLTFQSTDGTVIKLRFEVDEDDEDRDAPEWKESFTAMYALVFYGASQTIKNRPLLVNIKRLQIYGPSSLNQGWIMNIAESFRELFQSLRHLEELTICGCDMRPYPFVFWAKRNGYKGQIMYPPIKVLMVLYPWNIPGEEFMEDLVVLVRTQHERGIPFERVLIHMYDPPAKLEKTLERWVG